jgi:hypothetical protein
MTKILYSGDFPGGSLAVIQEDIRVVEPFIPAWVRTLDVEYSRYDSSEPKNTCTMDADYKYRRATLRLHSLYLTQTGGDRLADLFHEIGHCIQAPLTSTVEEVVSHLEDGGHQVEASMVRQMLVYAEDQVSEDLSNCLTDLLESMRPLPKPELVQ